MLRIVQITDTHLSENHPFCLENWLLCADAIRDIAPDLVVHTGDISFNGADEEADLLFARDRLEELGLPWLAIPGNHDIGDCPSGTDAPSEHEIVPERLQRYRRVFGHDWWHRDIAGWRLIGLNAQLFASAMPEEEQQWAFLEQAVAEGPPGRSVVFLHRPLFAHDAAIDGEPHRYVNQPSKNRLLDLARKHSLPAVCSGHTHQWLSTRHGATAYYWAPSTSFVIGEPRQPVIGSKVVGFLQLDLSARGVDARLQQPEGRIRHDIVDRLSAQTRPAR